MKRLSFLRRITPALVLVAVVMTLLVPASAFLGLGAPAAAAAAVQTFSKNGTVQSVITFSSADFVVEGGNSAALDSIIVSALPSLNAGILKLGDQELASGDIIAMSAVSGLRFYPLASPTVASTGFTFTPVFSSGEAGPDVSVGIYLLSAPNSAPVAQNMEISTYRDIAVTGIFTAVDPEGDLLVFRLADKPARGAVTLSEDGCGEFVYTPYEGKTGKDSFTYVAVDAVGNVSAPATVKVKIEKANTKVTYADMSGSAAYRDAIRLAEQGIFIGECMGGSYFFSPDTPVSRSEFVALSMTTAGLSTLSGVSRTGFSDDANIPAWAKPYVSSALKSGVIQGSIAESGQVVFNADATITKAEAAVLLNRMLQISDVTTETFFTDRDLVPAWAYQSAVNLQTTGVIRANADGALSLSDTMTRADAAQMLAGALDVVQARTTGVWPFG